MTEEPSVRFLHVMLDGYADRTVKLELQVRELRSWMRQLAWAYVAMWAALLVFWAVK